MFDTKFSSKFFRTWFPWGDGGREAHTQGRWNYVPVGGQWRIQPLGWADPYMRARKKLSGGGDGRQDLTGVMNQFFTLREVTCERTKNVEKVCL